MNNSARDRIFNRLQSALALPATRDTRPVETLPAHRKTREEKIERLKTHMEAVRTEVHMVKTATWVKKLETIVKEKQLRTLLIAPQTTYGLALQDAWSHGLEGLPALMTYGENIEVFKSELFDVDAALTTAIGGIADPGAIILWPTEIEPRLMSLVPHVHIALLEADKIYASPAEAFTELNWPEKIPTNALLISGPSKTADIEFILTFGVHGPKELILLIIDD
jgi:L-lactate dehydrogenase complex protein LldG